MNDQEQEMNFEKKIDENWKDQVTKEKGAPPVSGSAQPGKEAAQTDFGFFLSSLSMQALVAMGELPHPSTNERQEDLDQARYMIDVLGMLQEKTKGNLGPEEGSMLEGLLYELRMKYVAKTKKS